ncbi:MAG: hypothetical protein ACOYVD_05955 [Bacillota bacterium]
MSLNIKKILLSCLAFLLTLGILFGAYFFYKQFFVNQPLSITLENSEFIAKYEITQDKANPTLNLYVNQTADFSSAFTDFINQSGQLMNKKDLMVKIASKPNGKLRDFYQEIHPSVFEALLHGNYTQLQDKLNILNEEFTLSKAVLTITEDYIFLQLEDGSSYLYSIFTINKERKPRFINQIGSEEP